MAGRAQNFSGLKGKNAGRPQSGKHVPKSYQVGSLSHDNRANKSMGTSQEGMDDYDVDNEFPYQAGTTAGGLGSASASGSSNIQSYNNTKSKSGSRRSGGGKPRKDNSSWKGQDGSSSGGGSSKPQTMSGKTQTESDLTQHEEAKQYGNFGAGSHNKRRSGKNRNRKVFHPSEINYAKSESQGKRHGGNPKYTGYEEDHDQELQNEGGQMLHSPEIPPSSRIYGNFQGGMDLSSVDSTPSSSIFAMDPMRLAGAEH